MYHNNGRKDDRVTLLDEYSINSNLLTGLQLAKYVLMRLVDNQVSKKFQKTLTMMSGLSTVLLIFSQILDLMSNEQSSGSSGRPTNRSFSKPVEIGKEYTVDITDTGRTGDGVTRIGGLVVFVRNAKAGDKNIKIKINSVGSRFANAVVVVESADKTS
ncbi:MAG: TRAM domain-containing protein [Nitrososphaeraceae archaeon]